MLTIIYVRKAFYVVLGNRPPQLSWSISVLSLFHHVCIVASFFSVWPLSGFLFCVLQSFNHDMAECSEAAMCHGVHSNDGGTCHTYLLLPFRAKLPFFETPSYIFLHSFISFLFSLVFFYSSVFLEFLVTLSSPFAPVGRSHFVIYQLFFPFLKCLIHPLQLFASLGESRACLDVLFCPAFSFNHPLLLLQWHLETSRAQVSSL